MGRTENTLCGVNDQWLCLSMPPISAIRFDSLQILASYTPLDSQSLSVSPTCKVAVLCPSLPMSISDAPKYNLTVYLCETEQIHSCRMLHIFWIPVLDRPWLEPQLNRYKLYGLSEWSSVFTADTVKTTLLYFAASCLFFFCQHMMSSKMDPVAHLSLTPIGTKTKLILFS